MIGVTAASVFETVFNYISGVQSFKLPSYPSLHKLFKSSLIQILIRFLPDVCFFFIFVMFSNAGVRRSWVSTFGIRNVGIPYLTVLLILSLCFQLPERRWCLTRLFVENKLVRIIGYASYPIYLFQIVLLDFYFRMVYEAINRKNVGRSPDNGLYWQNEWFGQRLGWFKILGLIIVVSFGYLVQYYFQDGLVMRLWSGFVRWRRETDRRKSPDAQNSSATVFLRGKDGQLHSRLQQV